MRNWLTPNLDVCLRFNFFHTKLSPLSLYLRFIEKYQDITDSRDLLAIYLKENLLSYDIKGIPGDDLYILRAFIENLEAIIDQDIS